MYHTSGNDNGKKKREYQKQSQQRGISCTLCKDLTDETIETTPDFHVVENIFPYEHWDGQGVLEHNLLVTRSHIRHLEELSTRQRIELIDLIAKYEKLGFNIYKRAQENAKGSIPGHIHWHLLKVDQKKITSMNFRLDPYSLEFEQE